jgi:hypothetical protein
MQHRAHKKCPGATPPGDRGEEGEVPAVREARKKAVSLRVFAGDARRIKRLSERLGVRESEVIRFAIKMMLTRLSPLCDPDLRGKQVVPVLLDAGSEMLGHFRFDAAELAEIINEGAPENDRVDPGDLELLARLGGGPQEFVPAGGGYNGHHRNGNGHEPPPAQAIESKLRAKYGQVDSPGAPGSAPDEP